ncbi:unnamed protein product [Rotaria sordida]|uniref:G domain-containing protein n=1 Tax=Rotaria sordida TaxID=392033 RepID=A0A819WWK1_9BILA|nr:unnamed protein product [Rotaria sordida]
MSDSAAKPKLPMLKVNKRCPSEQEINILLLGQTGVGKTTFINSLANYLVNDIFDEAVHDEMQVIIPTSFHFTDSETFKEKIINIGDKNNYEKINENGQSCTQQCRSFVFPFGKRNLRLIDTPGMGDTRGSQQDNENLFEILTYISHYEHLNGICIFLRPNEERLIITFRLFIKQILHYLHPNASENITFILTNARSTFYTPGSSKKLLQVLINEYRDKYNQEIPFTKNNTFLLDNETFRYLALYKDGIQINNEQIESYKKSWDYTIKEYERLITYICQCPLHAVANTLSLNSAEQLIRKLTRPIAETIRLIQQNIQLAYQYKQNSPKKQTSTAHKLPQNIVNIVPLDRPNLVCKCNQCGCSWHRHMYITYEYQTNLTYVDMSNNSSTKNDDHSFLQLAEDYIDNLQTEQTTINDVYMKLLKFLHINAIHPCNDDIVEYLKLFIREEQLKKNADIHNGDIIDNLTKIMAEYECNIDFFKKALAKQDSIDANDVLKTDEIFIQVGSLYHLHINGQQLRNQINILNAVEEQGEIISMLRTSITDSTYHFIIRSNYNRNKKNFVFVWLNSHDNINNDFEYITGKLHFINNYALGYFELTLFAKKIQLIEKQLLVYEVTDLRQQTSEFLWIQLFNEIIMNLLQIEQIKLRMMDTCRQQQLINEFEANYLSKKVICWYLNTSFIYKLINRSLNIVDIDRLYIFYSFNHNLFENFAHKYRKIVPSTNQTLTVYRTSRINCISNDESISIEKMNIFSKRQTIIQDFIKYICHINGQQNIVIILGRFLYDLTKHDKSKTYFEHLLNDFQNENDDVDFDYSIGRACNCKHEQDIIQSIALLLTHQGKY